MRWPKRELILGYQALALIQSLHMNTSDRYRASRYTFDNVDVRGYMAWSLME